MRVATCQLSKWSTLCARFVRASGESLAGPRSSSFVLFKTFARLSGPGGCNSLVECSKKCSFSHHKQTISDQTFSLREPKFVLCGVELCFHFFSGVFWFGYHDVARFSRQRPVRGDSQLQRKISALVIFRFTYFYIELYTLRIRVGKHLLNKYDGHYFYSAQISSFKRAEHSLVVRNPTSDNLGL